MHAAGAQAAALETYFNGLMAAAWGEEPTRIAVGTQSFRFGAGLTVDQKLAALGAKAGPLFASSAALRALLVSADPTADERLSDVPAEYAGRLVYHEDGTVTLDPA